MSIFSDMIKSMVQEEIKNAFAEINTPPTPEPTPEPEPTPTVTPEPTPTVTPEPNTTSFDVNAFRAELKNELGSFLKDALNGEIATVEEINPDDALKAILGFDK